MRRSRPASVKHVERRVPRSRCRWAGHRTERFGLSGTCAQKIAAWEAGEALPTYAQIEQMAGKFKAPVAVFFPKPRAVPPIEQSFRTLTPDDFAAIPRTVRLFLRRGQAMRLNLAELNDEKNEAQEQRVIDALHPPDRLQSRPLADAQGGQVAGCSAAERESAVVMPPRSA